MSFHTGIRITVPLLAAAITGCADLERAPTAPGWNIEGVAHAPVASDPMLAVLQAGYLRLARAELEEYDWNDGADFLLKADIAAQGSPPPPFALADRQIDDDALRIRMAAAETELLALLASQGALLRAPREIATAQIDWECWIQESEEGHQNSQIEACRAAFARSLAAAKKAAQLPEVLVVVLPEEGGKIGGIVMTTEDGGELVLDEPFAAGSNSGALTVLEEEVREVFAKALDARPPTPSFYTIVFEAGSNVIDSNGLAIVAQIIDDIRQRTAPEIVLVGYSDGDGGDDAELLLSRRRAEEVRSEISAALSADEQLEFSTAFVDEAELEERRNRRVEVTVR